MKTKRYFLRYLILISLLFPQLSFAGPGDTTVVQTFTWGWPVNPGWGAPREGWFLFPSDTVSYSKILLYYTLKCDPAQNPACGEWDYLTYTNLYQHTGEYDSTLLFQNNYLVNGISPDSFPVHDTNYSISTPEYYYAPVYSDTLSWFEATIGTHENYLLPFADVSSKVVFLVTADELTNAGFSAGEFTRISFRNDGTPTSNTRTSIRIKSVSADSLSPVNYSPQGFTKVYDNFIDFAGWNNFPFYQPFAWNGSSDLLIEFSSGEDIMPISILADATPQTQCLVAKDFDSRLEFDGTDELILPESVGNSISNQVTIAFWCYGDPTDNPQNNSIFEAVDSVGRRMLNVHLPWSDGHVYWDAGNGSSYDRIEKVTSGPADYMGQWNFWTFTKNASTGEMKIFLNGEVFQTGTGKILPMSGIKNFRAGRSLSWNSTWYDGSIDEFSVWDTALTQADVKRVMAQQVNAAMPLWQRNIAWYKFDENSGFTCDDSGPNGYDASMLGFPGRKNYECGERPSGFVSSVLKPVFKLEQAEYAMQIDTVFNAGSVVVDPVSILVYESSETTTVPYDTLVAYPLIPSFVYNTAGQIIDTNWATTDTVFYHTVIPYYSDSFEVVNRFELGRFITPYGNGLDLGTGWTWIYDVTDFRSLLSDSVHLTAGNWQELLDMKFIMIEGRPPRDVIQIQNLWNGDFALNNFIPANTPKTIFPDPASVAHKLRIVTTGHQFDNPTSCAEFCSNYHHVYVNGQERFFWQIMQGCAMNPLYPQGGTWLYARAGWCPGMEGKLREFEITPWVQADSVTLGYACDFDNYGNYVVESQLVSYGPPNFNIDAALKDVISPSMYEIHSRFNPICGKPVIVLQNLGENLLHSVDITYGPSGGNTNQYTWNGNLEFLESEQVTLPAFDWGNYSSDTFVVTLENPNGSLDENTINDMYYTRFEEVPVYDHDIVVFFYANSVPWENMYQVIDDQGVIVHQKNGFNASTLNKDTLYLDPGCYEFVVYDWDEDGMNFWANTDGGGALKWRKPGGSFIKTFDPDFGAEIHYQFRIIDPITELEKYEMIPSLNIYPIPASGMLNVDLLAGFTGEATFVVYDVTGRNVLEKSVQLDKIEGTPFQLDISSLNAGSYRFAVQRENEILAVRKFIVI